MSQDAPMTARAAALISDMVIELHFRGCEHTHPLIRRAGELLPMLETVKDGQNDSTEPVPPQKLHLMAAEAVSVMDLDDKLARGEVTWPDLAEAAFTFENELMAVLGDDNAMPMEAYTGSTEAELINIIRSAVDNICRHRTSG